MRLTSLTATDTLSFDTVALDVSDGLSVIVGPNGSGKTNLGRLVRLAVTAVKAVATGSFAELDREWSLAGRYGSTTFEVRLGAAFEDENEQSLIEDWARAAVVTGLRGSSPQQGPRYEDLLAEDLGAGTFLGAGQLVVRHDPGPGHPWAVFWQTAEPLAHLDLWQSHAVVPGTVTAERVGTARSDLRAELCRSPDEGQPLPDLSEQSPQTVVTQYEKVLGAFTFTDLVATSAPVELIARRAGSNPEAASLRRLIERFPELRESPRDHVSFAQVLDHLLSGSLTVTENRRSPVRAMVDVPELASTAGIEDGSGTAVELLRLKNGDARERARFHRAQDVFTQITGRRLDVRQQAVDVGADTHRLLVVPVVVDVHPEHGHDVDIPLRLSGAGVEEAAFLAVLLTDDRHTLLLDEPATNLGPVAQRRLLDVLRQSRAGRQTILITHSAHLVPMRDAADLAAVTRLDHRDGRTLAHRPRLDQREFEDLKELLRQPRMRDLLFAAGVVLVEGPTEVDAFEVWLAQADARGLATPQSAHVVFVSVDGDERFAKFARVLEELAVPYAIVSDGPALHATGALSKLPAPAPSPQDPASEPFQDAVARWSAHRVRTLAVDFGIGPDKGKGEIEAFFARVDAPVWDELTAAAGRKDKPMLGYRFASRVEVPASVIDLWRDLLTDLGLT
ncbi:MAG: AAA family ATPase [Kineosporiaceae bacterium]|nr:AAA family ATPase [Kineosporiaceae bacterium]